METSCREADQAAHASAERTDKMKLPIEILLQIIHCVAPPHRRALIPLHHSSTQTLLSLARVCKATHGEATKLFRQHCVFLNTSRRLADLLLCIEWQRQQQQQDQAPKRAHALGSSLRCLTSLYLAPFQRSLDDLPIAIWACEMLFEVAPTLRRLVVKMPFASLPPQEDHLGVHRRLYEGLASLRRLEEFVCLDGYPVGSQSDAGVYQYVDAGERPGIGDVWKNWPRLRRLALFGVSLDEGSLWRALGGLAVLEEVILARAAHIDVVNVKEEYFGAKAAMEAERREDKTGEEEEEEEDEVEDGGCKKSDGGIRFMLMDVMYDVRDVRTAGWARIDAANRMRVEVYEVPTSFYGDESAEEAVAAWLKMGALDGRLWDWRGGVVG